jgi:hypothetical protein
MRKTLIYIVILAVLGAGIYFLLPGNSNENPFDEAEAGFTIKDTAAIGRIYLAASDGESITVERTDSGWIVNKQYKALPSTLNMLMATMMTQAPLYPVTKNAYNNVIQTLSTHATKVEIYDRSGKKMKVFYVGGSALNNVGTNMLMEGASKPYVVETPGFVGYLTPRYATKIRDWRDRTIFRATPEEIRSVSVQYAGKPAESYTVTVDNNDSLNVLADAKVMKSPDGLNRKRATMYLRFFGNINCEGYLNGLPDNDTTFKTAPKHSTIELTTKDGKIQRADLYWMALNKRSKNRKQSDIDSLSEDYDSDRMYAVINNYKDTVMIQQLVFHNILRKGAEFYRKDVAPPKASSGQFEIRKDVGVK